MDKADKEWLFQASPDITATLAASPSGLLTPLFQDKAGHRPRWNGRGLAGGHSMHPGAAGPWPPAVSAVAS